jgi:hypothetical protein
VTHARKHQWPAVDAAPRKRAHLYTPQSIQPIWNYQRCRLAETRP